MNFEYVYFELIIRLSWLEKSMFFSAKNNEMALCMPIHGFQVQSKLLSFCFVKGYNIQIFEWSIIRCFCNTCYWSTFNDFSKMSSWQRQ